MVLDAVDLWYLIGIPVVTVVSFVVTFIARRRERNDLFEMFDERDAVATRLRNQGTYKHPMYCLGCDDISTEMAWTDEGEWRCRVCRTPKPESGGGPVPEQPKSLTRPRGGPIPKRSEDRIRNGERIQRWQG